MCPSPLLTLQPKGFRQKCKIRTQRQDNKKKSKTKTGNVNQDTTDKERIKNYKRQ